MDQPDKIFTSEGAGARNWIGGIIVAVILGEAIWSLIVSVMNNLVVPWLGEVMGQSSGLPTSFTQRPYNYPDLFVSVVEFCIAGIVAATLNFFFQRPGARRVKPVKSVISTVPVEGARVVPQAAAASAQLAPAQVAMTGATSPAAARVPPVKTDPVNPPAASVLPATPVPLVGPAPVSKPVAVASSAPPVADSAVKPVPSAPKAEPSRLVPAKPKKPKEVYYNIVGEPVSSDED